MVILPAECSFNSINAGRMLGMQTEGVETPKAADLSYKSKGYLQTHNIIGLGDAFLGREPLGKLLLITNWY